MTIAQRLAKAGTFAETDSSANEACQAPISALLIWDSPNPVEFRMNSSTLFHDHIAVELQST